MKSIKKPTEICSPRSQMLLVCTNLCTTSTYGAAAIKTYMPYSNDVHSSMLKSYKAIAVILIIQGSS